MRLNWLIGKVVAKFSLDRIFLILIRRRVGNRAFKIPVFHGLGYPNLVAKEQWMEELLKEEVPKSTGVFCDVGANVGQTALMTYGHSNRDMSYYAFEPNSSCCYYLDYLAKINSFKNFKLFPVGISNRVDMVNLNLYSGSTADPSASIIDNFRKHTIDQKRALTIGKDIFTEIFKNDKISILKVDVEGAESMVLEAASAIIARDRPKIICEVLPVHDVANTERLHRQKNLEQLLQSLNYVIERVYPNGERESLDTFGVHSDLNLSNYLFLPRE